MPRHSASRFAPTGQHHPESGLCMQITVAAETHPTALIFWPFQRAGIRTYYWRTFGAYVRTNTLSRCFSYFSEFQTSCFYFRSRLFCSWPRHTRTPATARGVANFARPEVEARDRAKLFTSPGQTLGVPVCRARTGNGRSSTRHHTSVAGHQWTEATCSPAERKFVATRRKPPNLFSVAVEL